MVQASLGSVDLPPFFGLSQSDTLVCEPMPVQVSQPIVQPWENHRHGCPPPEARTPASQPVWALPQLQLVMGLLFPTNCGRKRSTALLRRARGLSLAGGRQSGHSGNDADDAVQTDFSAPLAGLARTDSAAR